MESELQKRLRGLTMIPVIAADGLYKRDVFSKRQTT
jgi:hypothetical protein